MSCNHKVSPAEFGAHTCTETKDKVMFRESMKEGVCVVVVILSIVHGHYAHL